MLESVGYELCFSGNFNEVPGMLSGEHFETVSSLDNPTITVSKVSSDIYNYRWDEGNTPPILLCTGEPTDDLYDCG